MAKASLLSKLGMLAGCGLLALSSSISQAAPLRFLVGYPTTSHPPYYLDDGTAIPANNPGYSVEIMQELGKKVKEIKFQMVRCEFNDCLQQIKTGKLDGLFNVPYREEWLFTGKYPFTKAKVDPRQKLYREEYALYRVKDTRVSTDGGRIYGLKGKSVILTQNSAVVDQMKKHDHPIMYKDTTTTALQTLLQREAPAAVLIVNHVETLARKHAELAGFISRAMEPLYTEDYYLMLSRQFYAKKPWLAEKIWEEQTLIVNEQGAMLEEKYIQ
mgnify:CR=1 FL=1